MPKMITDVDHYHLDVGASSTLLRPQNDDRMFLIIENDSNFDIYISFGSPAVVNEGILLVAGGDRIVLDKWETVPTSAIYGIHASTGTKNVIITEG